MRRKWGKLIEINKINKRLTKLKKKWLLDQQSRQTSGKINQAKKGKINRNENRVTDSDLVDRNSWENTTNGF